MTPSDDLGVSILAQATSKGAELSAEFKATREVSLFASSGYTDVICDEFDV